MEITTLEHWIAKKIGVEKLNQYDLKNYQLKKISDTVKYAADNSGFYKNLYKNLDLHDLSWQKFSTIPFTSAADIQNHGTRMVCVEQDEIYRIVTLQTSGTTARPKKIYFTEDDHELTIDFFDNGMQILTKPQDNVLILLPAQTPGCVGDLLAKGLERFGAIPHRYGIPEDFTDTLNYMLNHNIKAVVANPEHMLAMANLAEHTGQKPKLNSILLSTDFLAESLMKQLSKTFQATVYEHYGMTETGLGGGVSCQALKGYHLRDADLYFEIINPQTGANLPDGSWGEVVFTTLTRRAMPLIRYRTGDYGRFLTEPCPCGAVLKRLDKIYHRIDNKEFRITDFDQAIFGIDGIFDYQMAVSRSEKTIAITIHTLNVDRDFTDNVKKSINNLTHGYRVQINTAAGFTPQHYKLQKRKIEYIN
ncbi:MAG: DVU_1553 family AMP-dependent CoA ligase [Bacillota bacterium]|jgi:phenylacetate-CoA ligase